MSTNVNYGILQKLIDNPDVVDIHVIGVGKGNILYDEVEKVHYRGEESLCGNGRFKKSDVFFENDEQLDEFIKRLEMSEDDNIRAIVTCLPDGDKSIALRIFREENAINKTSKQTIMPDIGGKAGVGMSFFETQKFLSAQLA